MAHYNSFEFLEVYKQATIFCDEIWEVIINTSLAKDYKLRDQINGSSGSVMDNIAEGFGRGGNNEFIMFLAFSRGSVVKVNHNCYDAIEENISMKKCTKN